MAVKISKLLCAMLALMIFMTACGNTKEQIKCESCGESISDNAKFCSNCGAGIAVDKEETTTSESSNSETKCTHTWLDATCSSAKKCELCGITEVNPLSHNWSEASCTSPKKCTLCGQTSGKAKGHQWMDATYENPKYCVICGVESGEPLIDPNYDKYIMAAHLYQAVIDSAKFPSSVRIERAYYIGDLGQGYPAVRLECAAANSIGGSGILYGVVIQYPAAGYEDDPYADHIYAYEDKYCFECNIYDNCPVLNYNGYEKLDISRIESVHENDINFN